MPFDALGMSVGPDEGAEEDEWDSKQTSITVQTSPSLLPSQCVVFPASLRCPQQPFTAATCHVGLQLSSLFGRTSGFAICP